VKLTERDFQSIANGRHWDRGRNFLKVLAPFVAVFPFAAIARWVELPAWFFTVGIVVFTLLFVYVFFGMQKEIKAEAQRLWEEYQSEREVV